MNKGTFKEKMKEYAKAYLEMTLGGQFNIDDLEEGSPEETIYYDYMEGAETAYRILNEK